MSSDLIFLKLGGSLLTDKTEKEALRVDLLEQLAREIAAVYGANPALRLVLGHGSGSFGHYAGRKHGTRQGVVGAEQWYGFAEVGDAAARLNRHVVAALLRAGVPALGLPPSASARVADGRIVSMDVDAVRSALAANVLPVVYGDVAFDATRGGTILSTEEVMEYLAGRLNPDWFLLAGETGGVYGTDGAVVPTITRDTLPDILPALGGSRGMDVTGGMASKVEAMLALVDAQPGLGVRIFSGQEKGTLEALLAEPGRPIGTLIQ